MRPCCMHATSPQISIDLLSVLILKVRFFHPVNKQQLDKWQVALRDVDGISAF